MTDLAVGDTVECIDATEARCLVDRQEYIIHADEDGSLWVPCFNSEAKHYLSSRQRERFRRVPSGDSGPVWEGVGWKRVADHGQPPDGAWVYGASGQLVPVKVRQVWSDNRLWLPPDAIVLPPLSVVEPPPKPPDTTSNAIRAAPIDPRKVPMRSPFEDNPTVSTALLAGLTTCLTSTRLAIERAESAVIGVRNRLVERSRAAGGAMKEGHVMRRYTWKPLGGGGGWEVWTVSCDGCAYEKTGIYWVGMPLVVRLHRCKGRADVS